MTNRLSRAALACAVLGGLAGLGQAQILSNNTTDIPSGSPNNNSFTENVDFDDVDLDGDWDAVFADGGDNANDQNRIWINQGGAQGGTLGVFVDRTSTQFPAIADQSRDIEFVDFDHDGDQDLYISNTSTNIGQTNRWWVNMGGVQGGTAGFYQDQTATRWVGLGGAGSSIANSQVLGGGGFIDFSCDCDFGDLDNDGDMDLVHSSYGGIFGGGTPTRIFLNDGVGNYHEFNPSGFQLAGQDIVNGNPGLWCEGTQSTNTTNATGANCDVASSALDIDVVDPDNDLDLDILHGARQELPRFFTNRLEENGGTLGFRDTTGLAYPGGYSTGDGHYEQEMGDLDSDGDLDLYGLNWRVVGGNFTDITAEGNGNNTFSNFVNLSGSGSDDNEGDFIDYDQDGDLDLFVAAFTSANRLYRNNNNGGSGFSFTQVSIPVVNPTALDGDGADVDGDGDTDVFVANDRFAGFSSGANVYYENVTTGNDVHAPVVTNLEQAPNRSPSATPTVIRVQVYDNTPYYITWYNTTVLEVTVNAGTPFQVPMRSSAGQVFRGEIDGNLTGTICYRAISSDEYGNTAQTAQLCYSSTAASTSFCDASDNALASCPCGNAGSPNTGCDIAQGTGGVAATLTAQAGLSATVTGTGYPAALNPSAVMIRGNNLEATPVVFGDGLRCVGLVGFARLAATTAAGGQSTHVIGHGAGSGTFHYQIWFRNTPITFCNSTAAFNLSNGLSLTW